MTWATKHRIETAFPAFLAAQLLARSRRCLA